MVSKTVKILPVYLMSGLGFPPDATLKGINVVTKTGAVTEVELAIEHPDFKEASTATVQFGLSREGFPHIVNWDILSEEE